ncbi:MAG: glycosyltransferase family 39 protein [Acidobacteriota bacterium]
MIDLRSISDAPRSEDRKLLSNTGLFFAALLALTFLLRLSYASYLFHDDGLRFTVAEEMLRGKALYREVYQDKPPVDALVYYSLFWLFSAKIIVVRLFMIFYSVAISFVIYLLAKRLYDRRAGLIAAAMFTFFSTTSVNSHVQGLNTDFLMLLPYTAGAYFFVRAVFDRSRTFAFAGGAMTGLAVQTNPKGIFALIFFAALLIAARFLQENEATEYGSVGVRECGSMGASEYGNDKTSSFTPTLPHPHTPTPLHLFTSSPLHLFTLAIVGFIAGTAPFLIYLAINGSLSFYWLYVWQWGTGYAGYRSVWDIFTRGAYLTLKYLVRNNTLFFALIFVVVSWVRRVKKNGAAEIMRDSEMKSTATMLLWLVASYAGLAVGGRFYSNYFFQILPALCVIGAVGFFGILSAMRLWRPAIRRAAIATLATGFIITTLVFHARTVTLAFDWMRGARSEMNADWYHEILNREELMVAAAVREWPGGFGAAEREGREAMRADSPREGARSASDYLFVWGARAEIYYWSGLIPASRFLTTQPLTGVPSDVHHDKSSRPVFEEELTRAARIELVDELRRAQPRYIVDEIGFFNRAMSIQSYEETRELMKDYERMGTTGRFLIYRRKERP